MLPLAIRASVVTSECLRPGSRAPWLESGDHDWDVGWRMPILRFEHQLIILWFEVLLIIPGFEAQLIILRFEALLIILWFEVLLIMLGGFFLSRGIRPTVMYIVKPTGLGWLPRSEARSGRGFQASFDIIGVRGPVWLLGVRGPVWY